MPLTVRSPTHAAPSPRRSRRPRDSRMSARPSPTSRPSRDISLDVRPGEILAFMGENGAGKSTLLKILNGDYQPDAGTMTLDGETLALRGPREARARRRPRHLPGARDHPRRRRRREHLSRASCPRRGPFVDRRRAERAGASRACARYGFERVLRPDRMGDELSPAQRQLVEIMRALKSGMRVLALDEPTSSLTDEEVDPPVRAGATAPRRGRRRSST